MAWRWVGWGLQEGWMWPGEGWMRTEGGLVKDWRKFGWGREEGWIMTMRRVGWGLGKGYMRTGEGLYEDWRGVGWGLDEGWMRTGNVKWRVKAVWMRSEGGLDEDWRPVGWDREEGWMKTSTVFLERVAIASKYYYVNLYSTCESINILDLTLSHDLYFSKWEIKLIKIIFIISVCYLLFPLD